MRVIDRVTVTVDGHIIEVERLENGTFRKPQWLLDARRGIKRIPHSGEAMMRHGGDNTRPWIEEALKNGYHDAPGDEPVTDEAKLWDGWGTALKPAWEPVIIGTMPA